jgi:hypothetical protein
VPQFDQGGEEPGQRGALRRGRGVSDASVGRLERTSVFVGSGLGDSCAARQPPQAVWPTTATAREKREG